MTARNKKFLRTGNIAMKVRISALCFALCWSASASADSMLIETKYDKFLAKTYASPGCPIGLLTKVNQKYPPQPDGKDQLG